MRMLPKRFLAIAAVATLFAAGAIGLESPPTASAQGSPSMGSIALTFAPGGVLTEDGVLWQFNMEKGVWITIDEAFEEQGQQTHVQPLPVDVGEIARMESFGFIVTHTGNCWLFDIEGDRWREIGAPPKQR